MSEPIAQRTLVKSPPELWAEVSDVEALARHLGAFGEIRITRVVPETTVAWEGETARGTVELSASGWGTKVTLTATATAPPGDAAGTDAPAPVAPAAPAPALAAPAATPVTPQPPATDPHWAASEQKVRDRYVGAAPPQLAGPAPAAPVSEPATPADAVTRPATSDSRPAAGPGADSAPPGSEPAAGRTTPAASTKAGAARPRGLFARIKWWFGAPTDDAATASPAPEPEPAAPRAQSADLAPAGPAAEEAADVAPGVPAAEEPATPVVLPFPSVPPASEPLPQPVPEPLPAAAIHAPPQPAPAPAPDAARTASPAPVDDGTIVGILTGVLDELGSAHHRPYSRAD
jgi:hypothetical protein